MKSLIRSKIAKASSVPDNMFTQSELKLFHIDRLMRTYSIQKVLRGRDISKRIQNLIRPRFTSICKYNFHLKVCPYNFFKRRIV